MEKKKKIKEKMSCPIDASFCGSTTAEKSKHMLVRVGFLEGNISRQRGVD